MPRPHVTRKAGREYITISTRHSLFRSRRGFMQICRGETAQLLHYGCGLDAGAACFVHAVALYSRAGFRQQGDTMMQSQNITNPFRQMVAGVDIEVPLSNGTYTTGINLDNAATTPPLIAVMRKLNEFAPWYSSIKRGGGYKSAVSTDIYEGGREIIKDFVGADAKKDIVIYTPNTTYSINTLAYVLSQQKDGRNILLSTWMEHQANDLPWRDKFDVRYVDIDRTGRLDLDNLVFLLRRHYGKVKLLTVTGAANVTGYINPIHDIAKIAHQYGTKVHIDAAQLAPHDVIDMKPFGSDEHIDYLSFSAHKMYAPYGAGVLVGPRADFEYGLPYVQGGSAPRLVTHQRIAWHQPPAKDEAGSPNLMGIVAILEAIKTLRLVGIDRIEEYERHLHEYAYNKIKGVPGIILYNSAGDDTISIIVFNIRDMHHQTVSKKLAEDCGISVRNGFFCAAPYCEKLLGYTPRDMNYYFAHPEARLPGMVRASIGMYNTYEEIDKFICCLNAIAAQR